MLTFNTINLRESILKSFMTFVIVIKLVLNMVKLCINISSLKFLLSIIMLRAILTTLTSITSQRYVRWSLHDVIMSSLAFQITSLTIVYSPVNSDTDPRKHQSSSSLTFVRGIHRWPVNFPRKGPVTRKMFSFCDVIMITKEVTKFPYCKQNESTPLH